VQHVTDIFVFFVDTTDARDFVAYTGWRWAKKVSRYWILNKSC